MSTQEKEATVFARRYLRRSRGQLTKAEARELGRMQAGCYRFGFWAHDFIGFRTPGGFARDWADIPERERAARRADLRRGFPFANYGGLP